MSGAGQLPDPAWPWLHELSRGIGHVLWPTMYRLKVHGGQRLPRTGPVVLVANHSALVDGPLLFGTLPRRSVFLIKHELFRGPLGWYLPHIGQLAVRRGEADRAPLLAAARVLREGGLVGVFPEGTRGSGDMATAQQGAAWLSRMAGAPLVPVVMRGTRRPEGHRRRRFRPRVDILFGQPLPAPAGKGRDALTARTEQLRERLAGLLDELDGMRVSR